MKNKWLIIVIVIFFNWFCNSQTKKINGISFVASPNKINQDHIIPIKKVLANYVALMPFGFIKDLNSPKITFNSSRQWFGETEKGIEQYSHEFRKNKIKIMLKPQIWVWRGEYTGFIKMNSEENWRILENSYSEFIITYAKLAQKINAEILCIGTELEKFVENRPDYWSELILKIKKVYKGKLTYAANWDEFNRVPFWSSIDFIGIDAYFPLSTKKSPSIQDFVKGWQLHKNNIITVSEMANKPVLFTEFGYRSVNYTGKEPWNSDRIEGDVDLKNQSNALEVIYQQFWNETWFAGGFLWKWFHNHAKVGGGNNNRFTPQNKPAEQVIKKAYEQH